MIKRVEKVDIKSIRNSLMDNIKVSATHTDYLN